MKIILASLFALSILGASAASASPMGGQSLERWWHPHHPQHCSWRHHRHICW
jgi:hypothetical protein